MKKTAVILSLALGALLLSGCGRFGKSTTEETTAAPVIRVQDDEVDGKLNELELSFTLDDVVLGQTTYAAAYETYKDRDYVRNNAIKHKSDGLEYQTVYVTYGNDTPVPEGYEEKEFGFYFAATAENDPITDMYASDSSFLCLGRFHTQESEDEVFEFFGLSDQKDTLENGMEWTDGDVLMDFYGDPAGACSIKYTKGRQVARIFLQDGLIHSVWVYSFTE